MPYEFDFHAVGKGENSGDAITMRYVDEAGQQRIVVIDGGYQVDGEKIVEHIRRVYDTDTVDHVVSSHPDNDHISGLRVVLEELRVGRLWMHIPHLHAAEVIALANNPRWTVDNLATNMRRAYPIVGELLDIAQRRNIPVRGPFQGERIGPFTVLSPSVDMYNGLLLQFRDTPESDRELLARMGQWIGGVGRRIARQIRRVIPESMWVETLREGGTTAAENESSVVLYAVLDGNPILLTADAGLRALEAALAYGTANGMQFGEALRLFQVPHHGSRNNISPAMLSRDSSLGQRTVASLLVQGGDSFVDGAIESQCVVEGLVCEMMGLEIVPDHLDIVELWCVFWQPLDGEPMFAGLKGCQGELADVDRPVVFHQHDRRHHSSRFGAVQVIELLKVSDEVTGALGQAGVDDKVAGDMIECADYRHFLGLARRRHPQIRTALGPGPRQIGMGQRLALVAIEQNDVASFGLGLAQLQPQAHALDLVGDLAAFQRVSGPPPAEVFFRSALDSCDRPILMPACASISALRRAIVQLGRSATGASSSGVTTRSAASVFIGGGPGATVAFSASAPPRAKSMRQKRTVSSRTPKASAMRGLLQPDSVNNIARARSASPRSRELANLRSASRCSSSAFATDLPAMHSPHKAQLRRNHTYCALVKPTESA